MHKSTLALGVILNFLMVSAALFLAGGTLSGHLEKTTAVASEYPEAYKQISEVVFSGGAPQLLSEPLPEDPALCRLEDVTLSIYNPGLISAEWISVKAIGGPGDVAVYSVTGEGDSIPGRSTGIMNLKLISKTDAAPERAYRLEYYVFGMKRHVNVWG